ncbi:MAG TPA: hypothetical protein VFP84_36815, partial [Kofleriaceae bacterium]|nr:hypothetical protein [Kofleriaceae bacterium]
VRWEHTLASDRVAWRAFAATAVGDGFAIAGRAITPEGERTARVWRLADDGALRWDVEVTPPGGGAADEVLSSVAALHGGDLIVAGQIGRGPGKTNVWVVRLTADGKIAWQKVFGAAAISS